MANRVPVTACEMEENLMAKLADLDGYMNIQVKTGLYVDDKTAETCLRLIECYINRTGATIAMDESPNGEMELRYEFA